MSTSEAIAARAAGGRGARIGRAVAGAACALWLAGCAFAPAPTTPGANGPVFTWSGRFAATWNDPDAGRDLSASGRFLLTEEGERVDLELFSPFGQTLARANAGPGGARLETADGRTFAAPDAETLTARALGWRVPIGRLPAWLRGEAGAGATPQDAAPAAGTPASAAPEAGETITAGWAVSVEPGADGRTARMALRWPANASDSSARRVSIRLVLDAPPEAQQP